ncbi:MAG: RuBisCO large subunit C-terminal-like domain-containing protein [Acidobacteriota bacterium]|nr:RuBisCO large subunit C-terminal-like domain-containing protein [Acidobacteriota bacterium]
MSGGRLGLTYELVAPSREAARRFARALTVEQTVEIPEGCYSATLEEEVVSRVEALEPAGEGRWRLAVSVAPEIVGGDLGQLLNVLFGNVSLFQGLRLVAVEWPETILADLPGPTFGIAGLRRLCGVERRPLLCAAVKPVGKTAAELASDCRSFALGGCDLVKDDHSLVDQASAPFGERVARCQEAVERANAESGGRTLYLPNLPGDPAKLAARRESVRSAGCRGVIVSPMLFGLEATRHLARSRELVILGHPTFSGAFFGAEHGIARDVLLGQLYRLIGCDGVIYVNAGGRFPWTLEQCQAVNTALRAPLGRIRPAFPVPAGGVQAREVGLHLERYGADTMILIGGSLYQQGDLRRATARLLSSLEAAAP